MPTMPPTFLGKASNPTTTCYWTEILNSGAHHTGGLLYYQPKQCTIVMEIPPNYHRIVLFDPFNILCNLTTPVISRSFNKIIVTGPTSYQVPWTPL